ncbi:MAG: response regulator transcription factor [Bdellovibrionaceae bacterium]|nr:response regulator transcription factor [Pseudobdellovibrionaceae bacterium]
MKDFLIKIRQLKSLKKKWPQIKLIVLAQIPGAKNRIKHLEWGADDCLTKPIDLAELVLNFKYL